MAENAGVLTNKQLKKQQKKERRAAWRRAAKNQKILLILSVPFFVYGFIFCYLPLVGWIMGFEHYTARGGLFGSKFVGLDVFKKLFDDSAFWLTVRNTLAMSILNLVLGTFFAILFAILLNEVRCLPGKKVVQTVSYLPHFLSWVVACGIILDTLSGTGIINDLLVKMHVISSPINFFSHQTWFWWIEVLAMIWKETGWNAIIYLAAIVSIDPSLYEAVAIDGGGRWARIKYVTLPGIANTIIILLIMNIGNVLNAGFEVQYLLGNDVIRDYSQTIDIYVLKWGIGQNDFALGTAAGIFKSVVSIVLIVIANRIAKRYSDTRLF
ncbi:MULTISPECIES: ABC transporter permease [Caproicibacterium]|uniref:ABC transporter permease subunit n=1 Tax=Caproicibacterium argilliputei TaxID=3030016 RepID=A0AA97H0P0_9FIRM|nr:ABC transporter permease subunit [Caproicibacterium argilliputei]WOC31633.1 ABC transporter permease subunit [Caproicibacterium argilliputei]